MGKEASTAAEKEFPLGCDSINTTTSNTNLAKQNNAKSSTTNKSSQCAKNHHTEVAHDTSTLTQQPSNRPEAAPRSMTASDTRPRVKKYEQLSNKETKTNPSISKQTEAGHRETRTCPACSRQFAKSLERSGYEQHFINCVDNLCQQATVWNSDTLALSVDRNANYNVLSAPKPKPKTGASVTALVEENKVCPACNIKFGNDIEQSEFERHVLACVEKLCQQEGSSGGAAGEDNLSRRNHNSNDKICPMCESRFPADTDQLVYERHVLAHFEDERNSG